MNSKAIWVLLGAAVVAILLVFNVAKAPVDQPSAKVKVPQLSARAIAGQALFVKNCAACHGTNAAGTAQGPPLVHKIYEPNHHGNISFQRAAQFGVRAHHWRFGNMPPVKGIAQGDVKKIVTYVRELQRANGIF